MAVAKVSQIISSSKKGFEEAIEAGLSRARKTIRNITGLEVTALKAKVENGKISEYRAEIKLIFVLED